MFVTNPVTRIYIIKCHNTAASLPPCAAIGVIGWNTSVYMSKRTFAELVLVLSRVGLTPNPQMHVDASLLPSFQPRAMACPDGSFHGALSRILALPDVLYLSVWYTRGLDILQHCPLQQANIPLLLPLRHAGPPSLRTWCACTPHSASMHTSWRSTAATWGAEQVGLGYIVSCSAAECVVAPR